MTKAQNVFLAMVNNNTACSVEVQVHWVDVSVCTLYASSPVVTVGPSPDGYSHVLGSALSNLEPFVNVSNPLCGTTDFVRVGVITCPPFAYPTNDNFPLTCGSPCPPPSPGQIQVDVSPAGPQRWEFNIN